MPDKVTVIIPTYNRSDSILRTLKSIINQSYRPLDIVIIDVRIIPKTSFNHISQEGIIVL